MRLSNVMRSHQLNEAKKEIDIHREYEAGDAFTSPREKGRVFIILYPFNAAQGVKKWTGIEFVGRFLSLFGFSRCYYCWR